MSQSEMKSLSVNGTLIKYAAPPSVRAGHLFNFTYMRLIGKELWPVPPLVEMKLKETCQALMVGTL